MKYHYDSEENSLTGHYQCRECRQIISVKTQNHKDNCTAKNGKALVFVFG